MRRLVLPILCLVLAALPGAALAANGDEISSPSGDPATEPATAGIDTALEAATSGSGGVAPPGSTPPAGQPGSPSPPNAQPGNGGRPVLAVFRVSPRRFYFGGSTVIAYRIADKAPTATVNISVTRPGSRRRLTVLRLGQQRTGVLHTVRWRNRHAFAGVLRLRLNARDGSGKRLSSASARLRGTESVRFISHVFPVRGAFNFGGDGSRFGAPRSGHSHGGQDMAAAQGTPVAAVRAGRISYIGYQAGGAGYYIVLDADGENFDYVYMHLEAGSTRVSQGQRVKTGERIANVGSTGGSTGPHLHFEIWRGAWFAGGHAIDPLPKLRAWRRQAH